MANLLQAIVTGATAAVANIKTSWAGSSFGGKMQILAATGALATFIGGFSYAVAQTGCRTPSSTSVQAPQVAAPLIVTNAPRAYTNAFPMQQPQLAVGPTNTTLENIASIKREGETFVVGTNTYGLSNQLNWVLYRTNGLSIETDESGSHVYNAPFIGVPTLVTNRDGTAWRRPQPLATNGPAGITTRLEFVQQAYGAGNGVGTQARITQNRPLLSWNLGGTKYHLPTGSDGTNIYAIREGQREYRADGAIAPYEYTWRIHWTPECQWLMQRNAPTNALGPLGTAGTMSVPPTP